MTIITRIAPSPTGFLHIGTARTALFNYLFAKHHGGQFLLRIEDTDRARSTQESVDAIINGLKWLGLPWDGEPVFQFARAGRHAEVARELVAKGQAYYCYCTPEELIEFREKNPNAKFRSPWRDAPPPTPPQTGVEEKKSVIRIKAPLEGEITIEDQVQGRVTVACKELDDMVLLRADGTPTYMLAVVVDDHDMNITHIIRGDDHLTNAFRQTLIYRSMGWDVPVFAHIPLIHGPDGAKLSKRHGALGVEAYRDMGYLPEALRNYLLRLGWAHGNDEVISDAQAIEWFDLGGVGKSPSRFDFTKLESVNGHYLRHADDARLAELVAKHLAISDATIKQRVMLGMPGLKARAKTLNELAESARIYIEKLSVDDKAKELLEKGGYATLQALLPALEQMAGWTHDGLQETVKQFAESTSQKLGAVAGPIRAALTGRTVSPSVFEVMEILGKEESMKRLRQ